MLGTLAKWLRVAGADCAYAHGMEDDELVEVAASGRRVLTRDRTLARRCGKGGLYVASDELEEQIRQVFQAMPSLMDGVPLSRCLVCNVPVERVGIEDVRASVPEGVVQRHDEFWSCGRCGRVYWKGTHVEDMLSRLDLLRARVRTGP